MSVHVFEHVCGYIRVVQCVRVYLFYPLCRMCEQQHASIVHLCLCLCLCLCFFLYVRVCVCMSASVWRCGQWTLYFCIDSVPGSLSVSQWFPAPRSSRPAASHTHCSIWNACALCIWSFLIAFDTVHASVNDRRKWISHGCRTTLFVGKGEE